MRTTQILLLGEKFQKYILTSKMTASHFIMGTILQRNFEPPNKTVSIPVKC